MYVYTCCYIIVYTYTYIFIHEYLKLLDVQSWRHAWCHCTSAIHTMLLAGCLRGSGPLERSTSLLSQQVSMHEQTNTLTCPQFEHMWLGFNHRTNSGIGHGETILTGQSKSIAWANMKINGISEKNTCIWTNYVLQGNVCVYMLLYYSVYIYTYFYTWVSQTSWCPIMTACLMSLHISNTHHVSCWFFEGFRPSWTQHKPLITTSFHAPANKNSDMPSVWAYVIGIQSQNKFRNWTWWNHPHWAQQINKRMSKNNCLPKTYMYLN